MIPIPHGSGISGAGDGLPEDSSVTNRILDEMLNRIKTGAWTVGSPIPSERMLMEEMGVSRIALREALSQLRALGVLSVSHGKRTTVAKMDSRVLGRLFPLMLTLEGEQSFQDIYQVRLALELKAVHLAAMHRSEENLRRFDEILAEMEQCLCDPPERYATLDLQLHQEIAASSRNQLFAPLLEILSAFVIHIQRLGLSGSAARRAITHAGLKAIVAAIRAQDTQKAESEMEAHLQSGAAHILDSGILRDDSEHTPLQVVTPTRILKP